MTRKFNKDLIRDFPFLGDLERELGELGHIRVNRISGDEIETVRGLPTAKGVLHTELREYPSSNPDEGFLVVVAKAEFFNEISPYFNQTMIYKFKKEEDIMSKGIKLVPVKETIRGKELLLGTFIFSDLPCFSAMPVGFIPANENETFYLDTFTVAPDASKAVASITYYLDDLSIADEDLTPTELNEKTRIDLNVTYLADGTIKVVVTKEPTGFYVPLDFSNFQYYQVKLAENSRIIEHTSKVDFLRKIDLAQLEELVGKVTVDNIAPEGVLQLAVDFKMHADAPATFTKIVDISIEVLMFEKDHATGKGVYIGVKDELDAEIAKALMEGRLTLVNNF